MNLHLLSALAVGLLAAPAPKDDPKASLDGTWVVVSAKRGDKDNPEIVGDKITFKDGALTIMSKNKNETGTYKVDASKKPTRINVKPGDEDKMVEGIFVIDGETMKLCFSRPGGTRPKEFATGGDSQIMLIELKRDKK